MLIAISGSQGSGKSTLLNEFKELGYKTVERKTSRSILADWGVTLQEVNNNPELTMKFQDEILDRKLNDEAFAQTSQNMVITKDLVFTERTFADLFTYALISLGKDNQYSDWLNNYYNRCKEYQKSYFAVFYLKGGLFKIAHDGVRGSNQHYGRMVDITMLDFTKQLTENNRLHIVDRKEISERIDGVMMTLSNMRNAGQIP